MQVAGRVSFVSAWLPFVVTQHLPPPLVTLAFSSFLTWLHPPFTTISLTTTLQPDDGSSSDCSLRLRLLLQGWQSPVRQMQSDILLQQDLPEEPLGQAQEALLCSQTIP